MNGECDLVCQFISPVVMLKLTMDTRPPLNLYLSFDLCPFMTSRVLDRTAS